MRMDLLDTYLSKVCSLHRNHNPRWGPAPHKAVLLLAVFDANDSCAVCGLGVRTADGRSLVDAAHIMPFGLFHNDDPRNGIVLCKNHHWGFDAGWFAITDERRVTISPRLERTIAFLTANAPIILPSQVECAPALEALAWHRTNVLR